MRYCLRTLLILMAIGPPGLAHFGRPIAHWLIDEPLITEVVSNNDRRITYGSSWNLPYETDDSSLSNCID